MAGHPTPSVRWLKNEQDFEPDGSRVKSFVNDDGTFGLIFESTEGADKGTYTAIAFSDEGMARSNANVAIKTRMKEGVEKSAPSFGRPMGDVAVDEGAKLRITTPVKGNPIPEFTWTKDGKPLSGDRVHSFSDGELVRDKGLDSGISRKMLTHSREFFRLPGKFWEFSIKCSQKFFDFTKFWILFFLLRRNAMG